MVWVWFLLDRVRGGEYVASRTYPSPPCWCFRSEKGAAWDRAVQLKHLTPCSDLGAPNIDQVSKATRYSDALPSNQSGAALLGDEGSEKRRDLFRSHNYRWVIALTLSSHLLVPRD